MMLGENGEGGPIFREHFAYWRLVQTAAAIGCGKAALTQMATRMRDRHAFGGPIGRFSHLQQKLAKHTTNLEMSFAMVEKAARLLDIRREREAIPLIAMAKASGIEFACQAAEDTMLTFGGEGYIQNSELGQRYADLLGMRIADGTSDVLRAEVVRRIYGYDFLGYANCSIRNFVVDEEKVLRKQYFVTVALKCDL